MSPGRWTAAIVVAILIIGSPLLWGWGTSGVRTDQIGKLQGLGTTPAGLPDCVLVHEYGFRQWGSLHTIGHDVVVRGCNTAAGELRLDSISQCQASSFLGPGTAECTGREVGKNLEIRVNLAYALGLDFPGDRALYTFTVHPDGSFFGS